ncbi:alpha/beta fold hydrolase [Opitutus sp. ER46]|uniref:alpha/beta fold hydrolase n=1 Tax=Opitutus sp. ER46 TaxID=2161864 RepID=UPI000D30B888|nr:alpha/beta fold hydrolase [Opitutus sp. ER46]PTX98571.1 alpha/beta hydrolase [Opitutus sp. ER46]
MPAAEAASASPLPPSRPADQRRRTRRQLATCLALIVGCAWLASWIQSDGGRVQVMDLKLPTQNGQWVKADLFRPRSATKENPAPAVIVVPGFQRSKEALSNISIELARRGVVVIAIDPYAQGGSSASRSPRSATTEGYGLYAVVDYVADTNNLNYVDKQRVAATGHSAGGNAAILAASYFGRLAEQTGRPSKLHAVYVSGYLLSFTDGVLSRVRSNVGASYARYDEGAYRNARKDADLWQAPEALRLINGASELTGRPVTEVELGRYYGDAARRGLRVLHNEPLIHPLQPYSIAATANQLAYFERVLDLRSGRDPHDQVWYWKELLTFVCLIAAFVALVPGGQWLLDEIPYFGRLVQPAPAPGEARRHGARFWVLLIVGAAIACGSYIPLTELSQRLFVEASGREQTWFFPQRMNNGVMLWALLNGLVGFALYRLGRGRRGAAPDPMRPAFGMGWRTLGRTTLLGATLFAGTFLLLFLVYYLFHVDYRFLFLGARTFDPPVLGLLLMYAPAFFPFFLANSVRVNGAICGPGVPEWRGMLVGGVANSLGLILIVVVQYLTFAITGTVYWTDGWLYINLLFGVVPMMFILPYFNRYFYRMTGGIYLGPLVTCPVFIMILVSNTVCYLPF